jgi:hypothetical protein
MIVFLGIIQKVYVNIRLKTLSEKENMSPEPASVAELYQAQLSLPLSQ